MSFMLCFIISFLFFIFSGEATSPAHMKMIILVRLTSLHFLKAMVNQNGTLSYKVQINIKCQHPSQTVKVV